MPRHKLAEPHYRLRRRGRVFVIDWTDEISGRTRSVSTGAEKRAAAEIWRDQWIAGRGQPLPPAQPRISDILDGYLADRRPRVAAFATLEYAAAKHQTPCRQPRAPDARSARLRRPQDPRQGF